MELTLVGIGTGNPDHLTLQAVEAIRTADLLLIPNKGEGKQELALALAASILLMLAWSWLYFTGHWAS